MARMGIRELRDNLTTTIRRVRAGETIEVTHHGVPVAVVSPAPADRIGRLVAEGQVTAPTRPWARLRRFPITGASSASEALAEDRAER
jgi:prevent-host-death family protein